MKRFYKNMILIILITGLIIPLLLEAKVFLANGIKIGEADQNSVIIWTRITKNKEFNRNGISFKKSSRIKSGKNGKTLDDTTVDGFHDKIVNSLMSRFGGRYREKKG